MSDSETASATSGYETTSLMSSSDDDFIVHVDTSCSDSDDDWEVRPQVQLPHNLPQGAAARARYEEGFARLLDMDLWPSLREQGGAVGGVEEAESGESTSGSSRFADTEDSDDDEFEDKEEMQQELKGASATGGLLPSSLVVSSDDGYYLPSDPHGAPMRYPVYYPAGRSVDFFVVHSYPAPSRERCLALSQKGLTNVHQDRSGCHRTSILSFGTVAPVWSCRDPIVSSRRS